MTLFANQDLFGHAVGMQIEFHLEATALILGTRMAGKPKAEIRSIYSVQSFEPFYNSTDDTGL